MNCKLTLQSPSPDILRALIDNECKVILKEVRLKAPSTECIAKNVNKTGYWYLYVEYCYDRVKRVGEKDLMKKMTNRGES